MGVEMLGMSQNWAKCTQWWKLCK